MKMIFASIADFIQYYTSDDICKDGLVVFPRSTPTGLLHQWRSEGGTLVHVPPSSERLNGLALMIIHKDIHYKYDDVIDQYVMQQNRRLHCE